MIEKTGSVNRWSNCGVKGLAQGHNSNIPLSSLRFEPATFSSQAQRPSRLNHTPPWLQGGPVCHVSPPPPPAADTPKRDLHFWITKSRLCSATHSDGTQKIRLNYASYSKDNQHFLLLGFTTAPGRGMSPDSPFARACHKVGFKLNVNRGPPRWLFHSSRCLGLAFDGMLNVGLIYGSTTTLSLRTVVITVPGNVNSHRATLLDEVKGLV